MVFFIPWRVVAEESGAAQYGFGGAMLLDLLGPPGLAGGAVADFFFVISGSGRRWSSGDRSERRCGRCCGRCGATGVDAANTLDRKPR
jgi:hypothetical protein